MADKKNINYTNNDGAKFRYSAPRDVKSNVKAKTEKVKEALTKRAVFWRTNKAFAAIVLCVVILLFSMISIWRSVASVASDVEDQYPKVKSEVTELTLAAKSLASLSEAMGGDVSDIREGIATLEECAKTPFWSDADAAKKLHERAETTYNRILLGDAGADAKESAKEYFEAVDSSFKSLGSYTGYKMAAEEYNDTVSRFPVSILGRDKAPVFEQYGDAAVEEKEEESENIISLVASKIAKLSVFQIVVIVAVIAIAVGSVIGKSKK